MTSSNMAKRVGRDAHGETLLGQRRQFVEDRGKHSPRLPSAKTTNVRPEADQALAEVYVAQNHKCPARGRTNDCGARENRTPDILLAKQALYQLSYGPEESPSIATISKTAPVTISDCT